MGPWDLFLPPLYNTPFALFDLWLINQDLADHISAKSGILSLNSLNR